MKLLNDTLEKIKPVDRFLEESVQKKLDNLTKPQGSLGVLEELAKRIVLVRGNLSASIKSKTIFTMASDHGVVDEGISLFPKEVTAQMVYNFLQGGAGINVLARHCGARVVIVDMGVASDLRHHEALVVKKVGYGTKNFINGPAMTEQQAVAAIEHGIAVFEEEYKKGLDCVGTGEMGIGNTTASAAIASVVIDAPVHEIAGQGTGLNDERLLHKIAVIKKAVKINAPDKDDGIDVLSKVGGFEIGGLAGVILAASARGVPVVIDGFISTAAALIAYKLKSEVKDYMFASHLSKEKGHGLMLNFLGLKPILNLDMRLGEGTGAVLAMSIIEAGVKILNEMASFDDAKVSRQARSHPKISIR